MKQLCAIAGLFALQACMSVGDPNYPANIAPTPASSNRQNPVTTEDAANYTNVCHLTIHRRWLGIFGRPGKYGSAVLYRGRYLLTAGHNLYNPWYNRVSSIEVRCGVTNADATAAPDHQLVAGTRGRTARGYRWGPFNGDQFQRDFGVLRLNTPISTLQPVTLLTESPSPGATVELAGYPGRPIRDALTLYAGSGRLLAPDRHVLRYDIVTAKGNSGGPVWIRAGNSLQLAAIHVTNSGGRAVNRPFIDEVNDMINDLERQD